MMKKAYALKIIPVLSLCGLLLGACAPGTEPAGAASSEPAAPASDSAPALGGPGLEFETAKVVPGCRNTLASPLKMTGASDAVDFSRWTAVDLDGGAVDQDLLKGSRLTLVNVWATFCGGHAEDLTALQSLYESYPREDLNIVGIVASAQTPDGAVNEDEIGYVKYLLEMTGAEYPQMLPSDDLIQIKLKDLGVIPESFLLDSAGNLVGEPWIGSRDVGELRQIVDAALR